MLSKKDHICYCLATACLELLSEDKVEYTGKTKSLKQEFIQYLAMTKMYYQPRINFATYEWYKKVIRAFDSKVPVGSKWIPLLLANEIIGAWLSDNSKHLKFWSKYDFSEIYDHLEGTPEDTEKQMYLVAQCVISMITGEKYDHDKNVRKLKLKAIRLRIKHETA